MGFLVSELRDFGLLAPIHISPLILQPAIRNPQRQKRERETERESLSSFDERGGERAERRISERNGSSRRSSSCGSSVR